ncbi:MAG: hypothetical protein LBG31_04035 [Prevotellaceae bacterium]|nr:hypothetical protein [Prevotellaceae bacterium]
MNNLVRKRGGKAARAFRAAHCRCIVENPCAARVQGGTCGATKSPSTVRASLQK